MLQLKFINRKGELKALEERFKSGKPEFVMVYGRRRVGKTELAVHFIRNKPAVYFLAEEKRYQDNLNEMKDIMGEFLKDEEFKLIRFESWAQLFRSFLARIKERTVVIIDEFPYLVKETSVPSEFQKIWDTQLSKSDKITLVLIGSSVSMMEKLLGRKSPLFGRRTAQLEIKPMDIFQAKEFLPGYSMEDCIRAYACVDGIPLYLRQFDESAPVFENIRNAFFRKDALLYGEADMLLRQEFREPANYFAILKAISFGNTRQNEIVNYTNIDKGIISKYLQNLEGIRIIKKEYPATDRKEKRKNMRYEFSDNYFWFWFRFIYPNKTLIESKAEEAFEIMKKNYDMYLGRVFEKVAGEFIWNLKDIKFTKLGRWWHKDKEIDLIALDDDAKNIFFFECKWKYLKENAARNIIEELKAKSKFVEWNNGSRKERFGLIAKHIDGKNRLKAEGFLIFDLDDFRAF